MLEPAFMESSVAPVRWSSCGSLKSGVQAPPRRLKLDSVGAPLGAAASDQKIPTRLAHALSIEPQPVRAPLQPDRLTAWATQDPARAGTLLFGNDQVQSVIALRVKSEMVGAARAQNTLYRVAAERLQKSGWSSGSWASSWQSPAAPTSRCGAGKPPCPRSATKAVLLALLRRARRVVRSRR